METPTPSAEPTATPEPNKLEDLNVEFYLEPYNSNETKKIYIYAYYSNHSNETAFIEKDAYLTTRGTNYPLELGGTQDKDYITLKPGDTSDGGFPLCFNTTDITTNIPIDEDSTLTFFFRMGNKRYKATINYNQKGGIYYDADAME